ncbi:MAG: histidinol-phosphate transaminase [Bacteroidota bacterium]
MSRFVRPELGNLVEYTLAQYECRIKLNQNENPHELPDALKREILDRMAGERWSRYPTFVPARHTELVANFVRWKPEGVLLGNGSNELLQLLFTCVLGPGKGVVLSQPTFTLYKLLAQCLGAAIHEVPMHVPFSFDVGALIDTARRSDASLVVVCSPNNPTGTQMSRADLVEILKATSALVVVDEAYVQFADMSVVELLSTHENLVVLQTFSKAMAAAGLRFGYGLMDPGLARQLNKAKLPYAVNTFTLIAAEVLMRRWNDLRGWIDGIRAERERVWASLNAIEGIEASTSSANFLLFETSGKPPASVFAGLREEGILIRDVSSYPMLERGLRVSIGLPEENDAFLSALRRAL